jgi:hypothetical protein
VSEEAKKVRAWILDTACFVTEPCPYCGFCHIHGRGADGASYGSRVPHCLNRSMPAYELVKADGPVPPWVKKAMCKKHPLPRYPGDER